MICYQGPSQSCIYFWRHEFSFKGYFDVFHPATSADKMPVSLFRLQVTAAEGRLEILITKSVILTRSHSLQGN